MFKEKILDHIKNKDMENLKNLLVGAEDMEILFAFYDISPEEQVIIFRLLGKNKALYLFEQLDTEHQHNLLLSFKDEKAIEYVNELAPDDRVKLLDELPAGVARKLIGLLSHEEREVTNILMGYKPETAGRVMTTEYIYFKSDITVEQAVINVRRQAKEKETIYTLFVTDCTKKLMGVLTFKELLLADADSKIGDIMAKNVISVSTDTSQEEAARIIKELNLLAIPVVDTEERLVGIVTIDDAVDIIEDEATEAIEKMAALNPSEESYLKTSVFKHTRNRIFWLMVLMLSATITASIIEDFEDSLAILPILVAFIPMLMDTGGNAGAQSSALIIRGMALGEVHFKNIVKILWREVRVGVLCGFILGAVNFVRIYFMNGKDYRLSLTVTIALIATVVIAKSLGCLLPLFATKVKIDPAVLSAPIITTIADASSLIIYFYLAKLILGI